MITDINKIRLLQLVKDNTFSTKEIFGKYGSVDMYKDEHKRFYEEADGNIDSFIDSLPTRLILLDNVFPTQDRINEDSFTKILDGEQVDENDLPFVIENELGFFILDGHHRLSIEKLKGAKTVIVKVF